MELTFIGAAHEVTGSCHCVRACGKTILIDHGMEQGKDLFENAPLPYSAASVDFVLLTHAHIDHSGLLPLLYKNGFRGKVYATQATYALCTVMLKDSAHIQSSEAQWRNRKAKRAGQVEVEPLYNFADVDGLLAHFAPLEYNHTIELAPGIRMRFFDVGHLLGSAGIELWLKENNVEKKIVFSGDIGNTNRPLVKDPQTVASADYVVMESTYGDRVHERAGDYLTQLRDIIRQTFLRGGNVVIPAFAVGRTQEMLYNIRKIKPQLAEFGDFDVYVDSPLAIEATKIFDKSFAQCFDDEAMELMRQGINPIVFNGLKFSVTTQESIAINDDPKPKVILAASGMCEAGRIRHHLKHNLWRPQSSVVFVGFQSPGTIGRTLLDGASTISLFGEAIQVRAQIERIDGISGHADQAGLLDWVSQISSPIERIFVVHGEDTVTESFAALLQQTHNLNAYAPYSGAVVDLSTNSIVAEGTRLAAPTRAARTSTIYNRLMAAGQRLIAIIQKNQHSSNQQLGRFADQIVALCERWDK